MGIQANVAWFGEATNALQLCPLGVSALGYSREFTKFKVHAEAPLFNHKSASSGSLTTDNSVSPP